MSPCAPVADNGLFSFTKLASRTSNTKVATTLISSPNLIQLYICCEMMDTLKTRGFETPKRSSFVSNNRTGLIYDTDETKTNQT